MAEQKACKTTDIAPGTAFQSRLKNAAGKSTYVAIIHTEDGEFYAIGDECSHGEVSLSEGEIEGCEIECWAHGARFDFRTGEATELPAMSPVAAYPIRIDGDSVFVDIDSTISESSNA